MGQNAEKVLDEIETGADLVSVASGTDIGANAPIHKGNMTTGLDADTIDGIHGVDIDHTGSATRPRGVNREQLGLQLWHPFDAQIGGEFDDYSGVHGPSNGHGIAITGGKYGNAADFQSANNDYIGTRLKYDKGSGARTHGLTVTFWLNDDSGGDSGGRYIASDHSEWWCLRDSSGSMEWQVNDGGGGSNVMTAAITEGSWQHWAGVFDPSVPETRLYRNGSLVGSVSMSRADWGSGSATRYVNIGVGSESSTFDSAQSSTFQDCQMDDVRVYHRTLSASTITDIYNNSA